LGVYQKGWRLGGALLRPARVKVTAPKKSADVPSNPSSLPDSSGGI
jgi:hypothetical protein